MNRRQFLTGSICGAASVAVTASGASLLTSCAGAAEKKPATELRISFQEGIAPGANLGEKLDYMESMGIVGFEPWGGNLASRVGEIQQALSGRNIKVSAICCEE